VILGNSASGGPFARPLLPGLWRTIGGVLPPGAGVDLTRTEFDLLRYFMLNPRRVLSKGQILQNVWRYDFGGNSNVVETYVSYLRKKLDALGPPLIRTIRQAGYMLETEE